MNEQTLPGINASIAPPSSPRIPPDPPRLLCAERRQIRLLPMDLESRLAADHPARSIWTLVEKLDLSAFENSIKSRGEGAGRPAIDPRILVTLWVFATSEGVGSARELEELCGVHDAYRWICGGVPVCAHTLSDFRVAHPQALDDLLTRLLAVLKNQGLVDLKRVAQDGMRVRASAGAASFRREPSLKKCLEEARRQVEEVAGEAGDGSCERRKASRRRAAEDRLKRVERALELLPEVQKVKKAGDKPNARVSTTDPEARVMKMGDGGFRPAWNVQFSTDTGSRFIAGVDVDNRGNDYGRLDPMVDQIASRTGLNTQAVRPRSRRSPRRRRLRRPRGHRQNRRSSDHPIPSPPETSKRRRRSASAQTRRSAGYRRLAPAHGHPRGEGNLQAASRDRGNLQRKPQVPQRSRSLHRPNRTQGQMRRPLGRHRLRPAEVDLDELIPSSEAGGIR